MMNKQKMQTIINKVKEGHHDELINLSTAELQQLVVALCEDKYSSKQFQIGSKIHLTMAKHRRGLL